MNTQNIIYIVHYYNILFVFNMDNKLNNMRTQMDSMQIQLDNLRNKVDDIIINRG